MGGLRWIGVILLLVPVVLLAQDKAGQPAASATAGTEPGEAAAEEALLKEQGVPLEGAGLLDYVRQRLTSRVSEAEIRRLVEQLGDDTFAVREQAFRRLAELGAVARKFLQDAEKHDDLEIRTRAIRLLRMLDENNPTQQTLVAAIRQLGRRKVPGAVALLLDRLPTAEARLAGPMQEALQSLAVVGGKADPLLLAALKDGSAIRREAAGLALVRAGKPDLLPVLRSLLTDRERQVRIRLALELVRLREREAVGVLIEQMEHPGSELFAEAEEILFTLAGSASPVLRGESETDRRKYREAWQAWWKRAGATVDLAKLDPPTRKPDNTLIVLLDANLVLSLDSANKVRWQFGGVQQVLDIQPLPGDRVLLAEYRANRVTERDSKGKILWEHRFDEPLMAQRLANGNTVIASAVQVVEIDPEGKEVMQYRPNAGGQIMRVRRVAGGDLVMITQLGVTHCVRVNRWGREISKFGVLVGTSGGRLDVNADGHVLVPEMYENRICEYDRNGQIVRTIRAVQPIAATFQPEGRVLYTSMTELRAVEVDRTGKEVWEYRRDTKVTRAVRY